MEFGVRHRILQATLSIPRVIFGVLLIRLVLSSEICERMTLAPLPLLFYILISEE